MPIYRYRYGKGILMASILKISEAASLAIHAMVLVAERESDEPVNVAKVANWLDASEAHLGKIFQWLVKAGLLTSQRGPKGGFKLAKAPADVSLLDIFVAIDGPFPTSSCLLSRNKCRPTCHIVGDVLDKIHQEVHEEFTRITLKALVESSECALHRNLTAKTKPASDTEIHTSR
jgi:Rrf2 family protein